MHVRRLWLVLAVAAVACSSGPTVADVGGVELLVPDGWSEQPRDAGPDGSDVAPEVVASQSWSADDGVDYLQVLVGCDGTAADLARAAAQAPRDPLVVTEAVEVAAPDVAGLDAVHRLQLILGAGRADDARTLRVDGLYGEAGEAIVLVELAQRAGAGDALADEVLGSVEVTAVAAEACAAG